MSELAADTDEIIGWRVSLPTLNLKENAKCTYPHRIISPSGNAGSSRSRARILVEPAESSGKSPQKSTFVTFHDALGLMYPLNWSTSENGEWETFCAGEEMVCGDVTEIYARYGARYFRLRDV